MARIVTYTIIMAGIWMLLQLAGIPVGSSQLLDYMNIGKTGLVGNVAAILSIFTLSSVSVALVVGLLFRQSMESSLAAGVCSALLGITLYDFGALILYFNSDVICGPATDCNFVAKGIFLLLSVLWAGYAISIIQWWRGND